MYINCMYTVLSKIATVIPYLGYFRISLYCDMFTLEHVFKGEGLQHIKFEITNLYYF